jgi:hypothetical protein
MLKLIRKNLKLIIIATIICSIICGCLIYRKKKQKKVVKKDLDIIQVREETLDLSQSPQKQPDISALDQVKN